MKKGLIIIFSILLLPQLRSQLCDIEAYKGPAYFDTYHEYYNNQSKWAHYNVHDPSVYKDGEYYYLYNTDVAMGLGAGSGIMKRRSKDLIDWEYLGKAFTGIPDSARAFFLKNNSSYTDAGMWAPFIMKYKDEYRLYYSAPGGLDNQVLAVIGWATSSSADGPWEDKGLIETSIPGDTINTIDPTVVIDTATGQHWMAYGSYQTGIYIVELDSTTGGLKTLHDRGIRVAGRSGSRHAAIEGPEISHHNGWYYLFVSYDWLEDYYNVRVGRSRYPNGPYYDFNGMNMAVYSDNIPMIEGPYKFKNSDGWQGTAHCGVYNDNGKYYIFNQGRPTTSIYNMVLHVREIFWINDWPLVSPERYAAVPQCPFNSDSLIGKWEQIKLTYAKSIRTSSFMELSENGSIDNNISNSWTLQDSLLTLSFNTGATIEKLIVSRAWDWENQCLTFVFTGLDEAGMGYWGKKVNQEAVDKFTQLVPGAAYTIRSHYSNMLMEVPGGNDANGIAIKQGYDIIDSSQIWRIYDCGSSFYKIAPLSSHAGRVIEVANGSTSNGQPIVLALNQNDDKQKFNILSNNTGYYKILTKITKRESCIDLANFSIAEGGSMIQWSFLNGLNQYWKFTRLDSITVDTTQMITDIDNNIVISDLIKIYPNPNQSGKFILDAEYFASNSTFDISIYNQTGALIYSNKILIPGVYDFNLDLASGIYLIRIDSDQKIHTMKMIVN
jgi:arabinan endo-1,5-alpha-L-arabinosidase